MAPQPKSAYPNYPPQDWSTKYIAAGIAGCVAGHFIHLLVGALYSWGMVNIYITSYYKTLDSSVTLESNAIAFPLMMFCIGLTMRIGIYCAEVTHPLIAMGSSVILLAASIFISSYMTQIWGFFFFYGIFFGLILGIMFMIPIVECNKYFPGKKMYVNGFILAGAGFGSMVFGMFAYAYINPEKLHPHEGYYLGTPELEEVALRVPSLLKLLALLYLITGALAVGLLTPVALHNRRVQNEEKQKQMAIEEQNKKKGIETRPKQNEVEVPVAGEAANLKEAFSSKICWIEVIFVMLVGCGLYMLNGNYKTYVKKYINDDEYLTLVGVAGAIANGSSRFLWSLLYLKTGYKFVMLCILTIEIIVLSVIRFTVHTPGAYLIMIMFSNACLGGLLATMTTTLQIVFGQKTGSNMVGFFWCVVATTNFIQYFYVSNLTKTIGFDNIIYIVLGMACLAVPIVILTKFQGPWMNDTSAVEYFVTCQQTQVAPEMKLQENNQTQEAIKMEREESVLQMTEFIVPHDSNQNPDGSGLKKKRSSSKKLEPIKTPLKSHRNAEENKEATFKQSVEGSSKKLMEESPQKTKDSINNDMISPVKVKASSSD